MSFKQTSLGLIPEDWEVDIINNIKSAEKNSISMGPFGSRIKKENFIDSGVPIIRGVNLKEFEFFEGDFVFVSEEKAEELKASWVKPKDIVITHRGTLGQVGFIPENSKYKKYIVSQSGMKLTCDENKVLSKFLYYYLNSRIGQYFLLMNKSQVGVPAIAQASTSLKKIPVPLPPINEQKAIVSILTSLDEKIENNNQINKKLEEMAQVIFKRWFVDFEFPNEEGMPYKSSGGEMVESEFGMIPVESEVKKIGDLPITVSDYVANGSFKSLKENVSFYEEENYALFVRNTDLKCNFQSQTRYMDEKSYEFLRKTKLYGGEVIISNVGDVGSVYLCPYFKIPMSLGNNVIMINSNNHNSNHNIFIFRLFKSYYGQGLIEGITGGSAQPKFNKTDFRNLKMVMPSNKLLNDYNAIASSLESKILENNNQNKKLERIRDTLLPKLISGEIRVPVE
ncbi:restriction endonuclease subunit S [Bacillus anthracis]|uniref:restriction endonuclease subunit S n=1 Tax=Bacillus anthracis TaxID=1392 RepID=UPI003D1FE4A5